MRHANESEVSVEMIGILSELIRFPGLQLADFRLSEQNSGNFVTRLCGSLILQQMKFHGVTFHSKSRVTRVGPISHENPSDLIETAVQ